MRAGITFAQSPIGTFVREEHIQQSCHMALRHILHYLVTYPDAKDTIQGILRWWLPSAPAEWREEEVQEALDVLVARGWLSQRQTASAQQIYGVNKDKLEEIKAYLEEPGSETEEQGA
jgi:hypothetical protein